MKTGQKNVHEFSAGMKIPESGIYRTHHECAAPRDVVLIAGHTFPSCSECDGITFHQVRTAAYIRDDADFQAENK